MCLFLMINFFLFSLDSIIVVYMSAILPSLFISVVKLSLSSLLYSLYVYSAAGDPALFLGWGDLKIFNF